MPCSIASPHRAELDLLAVLEDPAGDVDAVGAAEHAHRQLGAPGAHQPGQADDLAAAQREVGAVDDHRGRAGSGCARSSPRSAAPPRRSCGSCGGKRCSRSRPTMPGDDPVLGDARRRAMSSVSIVRPSRRIVTESAIASISLSLCEMITQVMPSSRSPRSRSSRCAESSSLSAAVGSSRMSSLTSLDSALAISTSCCLPTPMSMHRRRPGSRAGRPAPAARRPRSWCGSSRSGRAWPARCRGRCSRRSTGAGSAPAPGG